MSDLLRTLIAGERPDPADGAYRAPVEGRVLRTLSGVTTGLSATVRDFDGDRHEFGPMPWTPRVEPVTEPDGMLVCRIVWPQAGDRVLIAFEGEGHNPWAVMYWPANYEDTRV